MHRDQFFNVLQGRLDQYWKGAGVIPLTPDLLPAKLRAEYEKRTRDPDTLVQCGIEAGVKALYWIYAPADARSFAVLFMRLTLDETRILDNFSFAADGFGFRIFARDGEWFDPPWLEAGTLDSFLAGHWPGQV